MNNSDELALLAMNTPWTLVSSFLTEQSPLEVDDLEIWEWHRENESIHFRREAMLVLSGQTTQNLLGKLYECRPGTLFLIDRNELHDGLYGASAMGLHLWMYILANSIICNLFCCSDGRAEVIRSFIYRDREMLDHLDQAWNRSVSGSSEGWTELSACFRLIACELYRVFKVPGNIFGHRVDVMETIRHYLQENCGRDCSMETLARMAGCSRQHLMRRFRQEFNCTIGDFLELARRERYSELDGRMLVKELADQLGFESASALCHWRKKRQHGVSVVCGKQKG